MIFVGLYVWSLLIKKIKKNTRGPYLLVNEINDCLTFIIVNSVVTFVGLDPLMSQSNPGVSA